MLEVIMLMLIHVVHSTPIATDQSHQPGYTLQMKTLFPGWPIMVRDMHTRRRSHITYNVFLQTMLCSRGTYQVGCVIVIQTRWNNLSPVQRIHPWLRQCKIFSDWLIIGRVTKVNCRILYKLWLRNLMCISELSKTKTSFERRGIYSELLKSGS